MKTFKKVIMIILPVINLLYLCLEYKELQLMSQENFSLGWTYMAYTNDIEWIFVITVLGLSIYSLSFERDMLNDIGIGIVISWICSLLVMLVLKTQLYNYIQPLMVVTSTFVVVFVVSKAKQLLQGRLHFLKRI